MYRQGEAALNASPPPYVQLLFECVTFDDVRSLASVFGAWDMSELVRSGLSSDSNCKRSASVALGSLLLGQRSSFLSA